MLLPFTCILYQIIRIEKFLLVMQHEMDEKRCYMLMSIGIFSGSR